MLWIILTLVNNKIIDYYLKHLLFNTKCIKEKLK